MIQTLRILYFAVSGMRSINPIVSKEFDETMFTDAILLHAFFFEMSQRYKTLQQSTTWYTECSILYLTKNNVWDFINNHYNWCFTLSSLTYRTLSNWHLFHTQVEAALSIYVIKERDLYWSCWLKWSTTLLQNKEGSIDTVAFIMILKHTL